jgi:hypothetical protein
MIQSPDPQSEQSEPLLPVEVEFYIEADGTVVFADLAADLIPIAYELNPDQPLACDVSDAAEIGSDAEAEA